MGPTNTIVLIYWTMIKNYSLYQTTITLFRGCKDGQLSGGGGENLDDKYLINPSTIDVYVENGLDPEVVSLVTALNKIEGIETITSCSGHGIDCLQIDLYCDTFEAIKFLIDILPNNMVIMQPTIPSRANSITLKLSATNHNVEIGHNQADNFAKIIMEKLQCK